MFSIGFLLTCTQFKVLPQADINLPSHSHFHHLIEMPNIVPTDKMKYIEELDKVQQYQYMFLQPRRWGKSTFLQTLVKYYDKSKGKHFNSIFGDLYIGKHPTYTRSSLLVILFDFSTILTIGSMECTAWEYNARMFSTLRQFLDKNRSFLGHPDVEMVLNTNSMTALERVLVGSSLVHFFTMLTNS
jgi:Predicted AAA-ATPase